MADWSELLFCLLIEIATKISYAEDFINFAQVCLSWKSVAKLANNFSRPSRFPNLMVPIDEVEGTIKSRKLYSFAIGGVTNGFKLPETKKLEGVFADGWMLTITKDVNEIRLVHPFTRHQICLPKLNTNSLFYSDEPNCFFKKVVFSSNPLFSYNFLVMVILGSRRAVAFCRPGDDRWTRMQPLGAHAKIYDIAYVRGKLYALGPIFELVIYDVHGPNPTKIQWLPWMPIPKRPSFQGSIYMLGLKSEDEDDDKLLIIQRDGAYKETQENETHDPIELQCETRWFFVFEYNLKKRKWSRLWSLGNKAVFLGHTSFAINAFEKVNSNCIYFTNDAVPVQYHKRERNGSRDTGAYRMSDHGQKKLFNVDLRTITSSPATWIESSVMP